MSIKDFIKQNKVELDACIRNVVGDVRLNDNERRLWLLNDEGLYNFAKGFKKYKDLAEELREMGSIETPDKVAYNDSGLDIEALDEMLAEL